MRLFWTLFIFFGLAGQSSLSAATDTPSPSETATATLSPTPTASPTAMPLCVVANNQNAQFVVGQANFTSAGAATAQNQMNNPTAMWADNGRLFTSEYNSNRVLIFNTLPTGNGASADVVVGQTNFTASAGNQGGGVGPNTISLAYHVGAANGKLYIADSGNNRILIFNSIPAANNANADIAVGQANLSSNSPGSGSAGLSGLHSFYTDGTRLIVADTGNNRVLIYNSIPVSSGASADVVLGQANFSGISVNRGGAVAQNSMNQPLALHYDGQKLFVVDNSNHRVLIYNSLPTVNDTLPDVVVGQPNFGTAGVNQGGLGAASLNAPVGVYSNGTKLYISDSSNHRVLIYDSIPASNGASANGVLGQANFTSNSANQGGGVSANSLTNPWRIQGLGDKLYITDPGNHRVLIYDCSVSSTPTPSFTATVTASVTASSTSSSTTTPSATETPAGCPVLFGSSATGSTLTAGTTKAYFGKYNLALSGQTVSSIRVFVASGTGNLQVGIFTDAASPGLNSRSSGIVAAGPGWNTINITPTGLFGPANYFLGVVGDGTLVFDAPGAGGVLYTATVAVGSFASYPSASSAGTANLAIEAIGCPPTPTPTFTISPTASPTPTATQTPLPCTAVLGALASFSTDTLNSGNVYYTYFSTTYTAYVESVRIGVDVALGTVKVGLYADAAGEPGAGLDQSSPVSVTGGPRIVVATMSGVQITPGGYWLALEISSTGDFETSSSGTTWFEATASLPNPATAAFYASYNLSIEAQQCSALATASPTPTTTATGTPTETPTPTPTVAAASWTILGSAGISAGVATNPVIGIDGGLPYVAYTDLANGSRGTVMKYNGSWSALGGPGFTSGTASNLALAFNGGNPYVAYKDDANGSRVSVMMHNGSNWIQVGPAGFSPSTTFQVAIAFNGSTPYIAYYDSAATRSVTVMAYDGISTWNQVGPTIANNNGAIGGPMGLAFLGGQPVVCFINGSPFTNSVMVYDGISAWNLIGTTLDYASGYQSPLLADGGSLYIAQVDSVAGSKGSLFTSNGGAWSTVGSAGFTASASNYYYGLAIDGGQPWVSYNDPGNGNKANVMTYNGSWSVVGNANFSSGTAQILSIAVGGGVPYVAFQDGATSNRLTVMKFPTTPVATATPAGSATSTPTFTNTPSASPSFTSSPTFTYSPTVTESFTGSPTFSATPTATVTASATPTATVTLTVTATGTATRSSTPSRTPTSTLTSTASPTATPTGSSTGTPTGTPSASATPSATGTFSATASSTGSATSTPSATKTATASATATATASATPSATVTQTFSATATATPSATGTPSATITSTATATPTATVTASFTATRTATASVTVSFTGTVTLTASPTGTPTATPSATWTPQACMVLGVAAGVSSPAGIDVDSQGRILAISGHGVLRGGLSGGLSLLAGSVGIPGLTDGTSLSARFSSPWGIVLDSQDNIFISDTGNHVIRRIDAITGQVLTVAGTGVSGASVTWTASSTTLALNNPRGMAIDTAGNLYIVDSGNNSIRRVDPNGQMSTLQGVSGLNAPQGLAINTVGDLFIADTGNNMIKKLDTGGTLSAVAGTGALGDAGDAGQLLLATLNTPTHLAFDGSGLLYVSVEGANRIRSLALTGDEINAQVGSGTPGLSPDYSLPLSANLSMPSGIVVDAAGNLIFAELGNARIARLVTCVTANFDRPALPACAYGTAVATDAKLGGDQRVDNVEHEIKLAAAPNPATAGTRLMVRLSQDVVRCQVLIYDVAGGLVSETNFGAGRGGWVPVPQAQGLYMLGTKSQTDSGQSVVLWQKLAVLPAAGAQR